MNENDAECNSPAFVGVTEKNVENADEGVCRFTGHDTIVVFLGCSALVLTTWQRPLVQMNDDLQSWPI
jgi:hypothetical protein